MSRLVDADALIDNLELMYEHRDDKDEPYNIGVRGAINMTRKAPTIEPKRGKWIKRKRKCEYKCSECGKIVFADDENELNFCCSCGADMREVRDE